MPDVDDLVLSTRALTDAGHAVCQPTWKHRWGFRKTNRPVFEGAWCCSVACLQPRVAVALRRETGEGRSSVRLHQHRIPLGLLLLEQGAITQQELQQVLEAQRIAGKGRLGEWLRRILHIDEKAITRCLARQWSCPVFDVEALQPQRMAVLAPQQLLITSEALPLRITQEGRIHLAFREYLDASLALAIERMNGLRVDKGLVLPREFDEVQEHLHAATFVPVTEHRLADASELEPRLLDAIETLQPTASRLVRVHSTYWLRLWTRGSALESSYEDAHDILLHL